MNTPSTVTWMIFVPMSDNVYLSDMSYIYHQLITNILSKNSQASIKTPVGSKAHRGVHGQERSVLAVAKGPVGTANRPVLVNAARARADWPASVVRELGDGARHTSAWLRSPTRTSVLPPLPRRERSPPRP